jgi:type IV fimbrial biogenesis protein FimT
LSVAFGRSSDNQQRRGAAQYIACMKKRTQTGFTLYELLITMLIVGVVLTLGIPNLSQFTANSRITSTSNDFHAAFMMARSEAARAKTNVTICPSATPMADAATCDGAWEDGFIVFFDVDGDLDRAGANETILRAHPELPEGVTVAFAGDATFFSYAATGLGRGNVGGNTAVSQIIVCDDRGTVETSADFSAARLFVATPLGRATVIRDYTAVGDALTAMGKACP